MNGVSYQFKVSATNVAGEGAKTASTQGSTAPAGKPFAPESPQVASGGNEAALSWNPPSARPDGTPGDNGSPIVAYRVLVSPSCSNCGGKEVGNVTSTNISGLPAGATYTFRVVARNTAGEGAASVATDSVNVPASVPSAPTNVVAQWDEAGSILVAWQPAEANGSPISRYTVISQPSGTETTTTSTSISIRGLDPNFDHSFRVRATNALGDGPLSAASDATSVPVAPLAPTNVKGEPNGNRSSKVSWDRGADQAMTYKVKVYRLTGSEYVLAQEFDAGPSSSKYVVNDLDPGVRYQFVVASVNTFAETDSEPSPVTGVWDLLQARNWEFAIDLDGYIGVRAANSPPYSFDSDGCSTPLPQIQPWDERFDSACKRHDFGSQNFGRRLQIQQDEETRDEVNQQFLADMLTLCSENSEDWDDVACIDFALIYYGSVNFVSSGFYDDEEFTSLSVRMR